MAAQSKSDLLTLNTAYLGEPYCNIASYTVDFGTLDNAYLGEPFYGSVDASSGFFFLQWIM